MYGNMYKSFPISQFIPYPFPLGNHKHVSYICVSISVWEISSFVPFFKYSPYK